MSTEPGRPPKRLWASIAVSVVLLLGAACGGGASGTLKNQQDNPSSPGPTATLPTIDPQQLLTATAANMESVESMRFSLTHPSGSIYVDSLSAQITAANGVWDSYQGADLTVEGYIVSGPAAESQDGIFVRLKMVITPDSYFLVDPASRSWTKQPNSLIPLPIEELAIIMADLIREVVDARITGDERVNGVRAFRLSGVADASVMSWTGLNTSNRPDVNVEIWIDAAKLLPIKARVVGPVGEYDKPGAVREITLSDINNQLVIDAPENFIDVSAP